MYQLSVNKVQRCTLYLLYLRVSPQRLLCTFFLRVYSCRNSHMWRWAPAWYWMVVFWLAAECGISNWCWMMLLGRQTLGSVRQQGRSVKPLGFIPSLRPWVRHEALSVGVKRAACSLFTMFHLCFRITVLSWVTFLLPFLSVDFFTKHSRLLDIHIQCIHHMFYLLVLVSGTNWVCLWNIGIKQVSLWLWTRSLLRHCCFVGWGKVSR